MRRRGRRVRTLAAGLLSLCLAATTVARQDEQPATTPTAAPNTTASSVPASRQADNVAVITIKGDIDKWTSISVQRRLDRAVADGADAVVFEIDTFGGVVGASLEITHFIRNSPIPNTVAWINTKAISAGTFIALACNEIVVNRSATMGDAAPIMAMQTPLGPQVMTIGETERMKQLTPIIADVVTSARQSGYDEKLVQAFIMLGVDLWMIEKIETGERLFVDAAEYEEIYGEAPPRGARFTAGPAAGRSQSAEQTTPSGSTPPNATSFRPAGGAFDSETLDDISQQLEDAGAYSTRPRLGRADRGAWRLVEHVTDGTTLLTLSTPDLVRYGLAKQVVTNDAELKAYFGATNLSRLNPTWSEHLARFLSLMPVKGFLIVVFLLGLFLEMSAPGVGLPGGVALAALLGLLAPQFVAGAAAWWGVLALVSGIAFLGLELFVIPGFGVFGVLGLVALFAGLLGMVIGPGPLFPDSDAEKQDLIYGVTTVLLALFTTFIGMYFITKYHRSLPVLSKLVLANEPRPFADDEADGMLGAMGNEPALASPGEEGVAITTLRPSGTAEFGERLVDVVSEIGMIDQGTRVRVTKVNGNRVAVEPMDDPDGGLFGDLPGGSADDGDEEIA